MASLRSGPTWIPDAFLSSSSRGPLLPPPETQLAHEWHRFLRGQEELRFASGELEKLRQLAEEMREVEDYVNHVRTLTEARDALAAECERENEQLRMEFTRLQLEHESQRQEVGDLLEQEGLLSIVGSSPSEQVAYLLVERSSLLERMEALEQELGGPPCPGTACAASLQDELNRFHQRSDEEFHEQQQSTPHIRATTNKSPSEGLAGGNPVRESAERGFGETPGRLQSSQDAIPSFKEEPDVPEGEQGRLSDPAGPGPEIWKEEMDKEKERAARPMQHFAPCSDTRRHPISAPDPNSGTALGREILLPRDRLCFPEAERKTSLGDALPGTDAARDLGGRLGHDGKQGVEAGGGTAWEEAASDPAKRRTLHERRCQGAQGVEGQRAQLRPQRRALPRETQDQRQPPDREEGELQEEISPLESEMCKANAREEEAMKEMVDCQEARKSTPQCVCVCVPWIGDEPDDLAAPLWALGGLPSGEATLRDADSSAAGREGLENSIRGKQEGLDPFQPSCCDPGPESRESIGSSKEMPQGLTTFPVQSEFSRLFNQELHNYKSELLHLYGELQVLQGAAEERDFLHLTHEKLLQKNALLETKVSELSHEFEHLNQCIMRERKKRERFLASRLSCPELPATAQVCGEEILSRAGGREQKRIPSFEANKMGEPEEQAQGQQEEEAELLRDILALQRQLSTHRGAPGAGFGPAQPRKPRVSLGSACGDTEQAPPHKEELRCDPRGPQGPCSSAEKQLRLEREKKAELKRQNLQLQQENIEIQAELRQAQAKLSESSELCAALASQGELGQVKVKELELQLLQQSQAAKQEGRLREQLAQESERAAKAEQRVLELQQVLEEARQEGRLWETQALGRKRLEGEAREAREKEAGARWTLQEERRKRVLWEQQREEQQQQLRRAREKETQLLQALAERQAQCQQQEAQLRILEEERRALSKEHLSHQAHSQKLSEQLSALQQEKETLCDEQRQVLKQVDVSLRKHNERRLRHKARLRHTKETLLCEVKQRDGRIRHLENEVQLSKSQAEKDQMLIRRVTGENEGLFREKRKVLQQLRSLEEAKESSGQALCAIQSRVQLLEGENKQLQDRTLQLSLQVGVLERALRTIHVHSLEELKSIRFPEGPLQRRPLPFPSFSFSVTQLSDSCSLRPAIEDRQPAEPMHRALLSPHAFQTSEISYLNVTVPRSPAVPREDEPGRPACCGHV